MLEAPDMPKNGDPTVLWDAVYATVIMKRCKKENPIIFQNPNDTFLLSIEVVVKMPRIAKPVNQNNRKKIVINDPFCLWG
jgi:hypothetical protein